MRTLTALLLSCIIILGACGPKVKSSLTGSNRHLLGPDEEVMVFELEQSAPANAERVGTIKIGDNGFTSNCTYQMVLTAAKERARQVGANAIKITQHKKPNFGSTCHRIQAQLLWIADKASADSILAANERTAGEVFSDTAQYALLYVYRPGKFNGSAVSYKLNVDDSAVCRVTNASAYQVRLEKEGRVKIWAQSVKIDSLHLNVVFGRAYYLKCDVGVGTWVGMPSLALVAPKEGKPGYEKLAASR